MNKQLKIRKYTLIAVLTSLAVIISVFDRMISQAAFSFLPMAKIGLSNVIILFAVYKFDIKDTILMGVLKSVLSGLILGSLMSFIIGFTGTIFSIAIMLLTHKLLKERVSIISVSVLGGLFHIGGQMLAIIVIYRLGSEIILYGAMLVLVSIISSVIVGMIANKTIKYATNYLENK